MISAAVFILTRPNEGVGYSTSGAITQISGYLVITAVAGPDQSRASSGIQIFLSSGLLIGD